jgi:hypothetical protein
VCYSIICKGRRSEVRGEKGGFVMLYYSSRKKKWTECGGCGEGCGSGRGSRQRYSTILDIVAPFRCTHFYKLWGTAISEWNGALS